MAIEEEHGAGQRALTTSKAVPPTSVEIADAQADTAILELSEILRRIDHGPRSGRLQDGGERVDEVHIPAAAEKKITLTTKLDPGENPFHVILTGTGLWRSQMTRERASSTSTSTRNRRLKKILRIPEAQQTDGLSELVDYVRSREAFGIQTEIENRAYEDTKSKANKTGKPTATDMQSAPLTS